MTDQSAVVWTIAAEVPLPLATLKLRDGKVSIRYRPEAFKARQIHSISLAYPIREILDNEIHWPATEALTLPPPFRALIPAAGPRNIQRALLAHYLAKTSHPPPPGLQTDWAMMCIAGHNAIGHLDVFASDDDASDWYRSIPEGVPIDADSGLGDVIRHLMQSGLARDFDDTELREALGPTPAVQGMIPKLLVSIPEFEWNGQIARPGYRGNPSDPFTDVVLKIEPPEYPGLVALEQLCLTLHDAVGLETPRSLTTSFGEYPAIAIERFDRSDSNRIPLESFFSVMSCAGGGRLTSPTGTSMENIASMFYPKHPGLKVTDDPQRDLSELFLRFCLALLTGNGDMHLENMAILGGEDARLAPVYDPAPMRAWAAHDLLSALPFANRNTDKAFHYPDLKDMLFGLGSAWKLRPSHCTTQLERALQATESYADDVEALDNVPGRVKKQLLKTVTAIRSLLTR